MSVSSINPSKNESESEFELLVILARKDPLEFEKQREKMIQDFIDSQGQSRQELLKRFQWRIDQTRCQAKNPTHALIKINTMMWDALSELEVAQNQLVDFVFNKKPIETKNCELIDFNEYKKKPKGN